jgi:hypothetical protein
MSWNKSPLSFDDVRDTFDRALATDNGIRIKCANRAEAIVTRSRFNYFRKMDRAQNREIYPEGHHMRGVSIYDKLTLRVPRKGAEDDSYIYFEHRSIADYIIEDL